MKRSAFLLLCCVGLAITQLANAMTFGIVGDYGANNAGSRAVAVAIKTKNPAFIITLGDNNYPRGCKDTIDTNIGQHYSNFIGNYHGQYGEGSKKNRFFPSMGNHDWDANDYCPEVDTLPYLSYFTLPGEQRYYDFERGNVHFYVLDSDPREPDGIDKNSKQYQWFKSRIKQSKANFNIVYFHHAPYSSSYHGNHKALQWDFAALGIDAVISGHDHCYERIERDGILYFVNGIGGADENYGVVKRVEGSKFFYYEKYGYMLATSRGNSLTFRLYSEDNQLIDKKIIVKK